MKAKDAMRLGEAFAQGIRDGIESIANEPTKLLEGGRMYDPQAEYSVPFPDLDPPSYLPTREPLPSTDAPTYCNGCSRAHGAGHDANCIYYAGTQWTADELATHDAEKAIDEANWLAQSNAEIATGIVPADDGSDLEF